MEKSITREPGEVGQETCIMGAMTDSPCPYPATEASGRADSEAALCAHHAAREPLAEEADDLSLALALLPSYLKAARRHEVAPLILALEQLQADFERRYEVLGGALDALRDADMRLFRR